MSMFWPREGGGVGIACAFPDAPSYAAALVLALSLGKGSMKGKYEFVGLVGKEFALVLETDVHPEFLQPSEHHQEVDAVSPYAADRLGVDEINLAGFTICHQAPEAWGS